jgi:transposase InsO family protein
LQMALQRRKPAKGLIHHSDRGSQYASNEYQRLLDLAKADCSMSRKGNCYDNAVVVWYNRKRRHSTLGYQSPEQYEQHYQYQLANCA